VSLLTLDTLDDRRELWHLLHRLPPVERVRFVGFACQRVRAANDGQGPRPARYRELLDAARRCDHADRALTNAAYLDLLHLAANWKLDLGGAAVRLEALARQAA
jgi:hypothetical protein